MSISSNRPPQWREDFSAVTFGIQAVKVKKKAAEEGDAEKKAAESDAEKKDTPPAPTAADEDKPDLVIWHWKDSRLQSMQQVQETADKNFSYLCAYRPQEQKFV